MKKHAIATALVVAAMAIAFSTPALAASDSEDGTIRVNVSETLEIDLSPNEMNFTQVSPGGWDQSSTRGYEGIEIENRGSQNITEVWVENSIPLSNPFGSGVSSDYDAGNFIQVRPDSGQTGVANPDDGGDSGDTQSGYHQITRRDFNATTELSYVKTPETEGNLGTEEGWRFGRFRAGDQEFFWAISTDTTGSTTANVCDGEADGGTLRVGKDPHTTSSLGSVDFTDSSTEYNEYSASDEASAGDFGRVTGVDIQTDHGNKTYDVLTYCGSGTANADLSNKTFMTRTRYNVVPTDSDNTDSDKYPDLGSSELDTSVSGTVVQKVMNATEISGPEDQLQPGEVVSLATAVSVPQGVANGNATDGTLRVQVNNN